MNENPTIVKPITYNGFSKRRLPPGRSAPALRAGACALWSTGDRGAGLFVEADPQPHRPALPPADRGARFAKNLKRGEERSSAEDRDPPRWRKKRAGRCAKRSKNKIGTKRDLLLTGSAAVEVGFHAGGVAVILISLHTGEVQGSIPCAPTTETRCLIGFSPPPGTSATGSYRQNRAETRHLDPWKIRGMRSWDVRGGTRSSKTKSKVQCLMLEFTSIWTATTRPVGLVRTGSDVRNIWRVCTNLQRPLPNSGAEPTLHRSEKGQRSTLRWPFDHLGSPVGHGRGLLFTTTESPG